MHHFRVRGTGTCPSKDVTTRLLRDVWGLEPPNRASPSALTRIEAKAYLKHYEELLHDTSLINKEELALGDVPNQSAEVITLIRLVKERWPFPITDIKAAIRSPPPCWLLRPSEDETIAKALDFGLRLWLFVRPNLEEPSLPLDEVIRRSLPQVGPPLHGALSFDFSAKSLMRKGGFIFRPTSYLSQHLTIDEHSRLTIYVFRHARVLRQYQVAPHCTIYPSGFLHEAERTMQLLFPTVGDNSAKRTRHYVKKFKSDFEADIEAGLTRLDQINLASYPFFGERLAEIQKRYNKATPHHLQQWWYDRRKRVEWATLMVAVVVFVLTVFFGIISSVTGILQVYASFKAIATTSSQTQ